MKSITFHCETITPMFLSGADGTTPELRVPSIKGALRFWWRAMNGHLPLEELRRKEGKIFGSSTEHGRSKIIIRITRDMQWNGRSRAYPTPHNMNTNKSFSKNAFRAGQSFAITLSLFREIDLGYGKQFNFQSLINLFLITATLGGLGGRVRRGFGAFTILQTDNNDTIRQLRTLNDINRILPNEYFILSDQKIHSIKQLDDNEYPFIKEIEIGSPNAAILKRIGTVTHDVKDIDSYNYENALGHASKGRFASPIYVSVIKSQDGLCPIIVTLNTATAPDNNKRVDYQLQNTFKTKVMQQITK